MTKEEQKKKKERKKEELRVPSGGKIIASKDIIEELSERLAGPAGTKALEEIKKLSPDEKKQLKAVTGGALLGSIGGILGSGLGAGFGAIVYLFYEGYKKGKYKISKPELNVIKKISKVLEGATVEITRTEGKIFIQLITKFGKFSYSS
jgi:hypothetical protein